MRNSNIIYINIFSKENNYKLIYLTLLYTLKKLTISYILITIDLFRLDGESYN